MIKIVKVGRTDYMGFSWFKCIVNGELICKYHALDIDHALAIHKQISEK